MVGTYSTVEKRAKRMPDATVETTNLSLNLRMTVLGQGRGGAFRSSNRVV